VPVIFSSAIATSISKTIIAERRSHWLLCQIQDDP
jgi:hypothetical protein